MHNVNKTDKLTASFRSDAPLRVIIVDDDPFARRVIRDVLQGAGVVVVAEARDGREAVELVIYYRPDVVLMDIVMPEFDGISATRHILKVIPDQTIVVLTGSNDAEDELAMQALRAGAVGFLSKDVDVEALPRALMGAREGEAAVSRRMGMRLIERLRRAPSGTVGMRPVKSPLTPREWEVIDCLRNGESTGAIADDLVVSTETVRTHVKNILRKLDVRSREEAVAVADRMRNTPPGGAAQDDWGRTK